MKLEALESRRLLDGLAPSISLNSGMVAVGDTAFFGADDGSHGIELWKSDGTAAGTTLVKDIVPGGASSDPRALTAIGSTLNFQIVDPTGNVQLWKSDGTAAGTVMLKDLNVLTGEELVEVRGMTDLGGTLFFTVRDANDDYNALLKSDGTAGGTVIVKDHDAVNFDRVDIETVLGSTLLLTVTDEAHGSELWKSDGTGAGTVLVQDINPGVASGGASFNREGGVLNGFAYFTASDGVNGFELWRTNGTSGGTTLVKDINTQGASQPMGFFAFKNAIYFSANDGQHGPALWKTDGTAGGTILFKDFDPNSSNNNFGVGLGAATADTLYVVGGDISIGTELWKTDGTTVGTVLIKDINVGPNASGASGFVVVDDIVYFRATDGQLFGEEYWKSDGTAAGTTVLKDINAGNAGLGSFNATMVAFDDGTLIFPAADEAHGTELWTSDGTTANTTLVKDINPFGRNFVSYSIDNARFTIQGTDEDDVLELSVTGDVIVATLNGQSQEIHLGERDTIVLRAGAGDDSIDASTLSVGLFIYGEDGNDTIIASNGNDWVIAQNGDDSIRGGTGRDRLYGGDGIDRIFGEGGNDRVFGGGSRDYLYGNGGNDTIVGAGGNDHLNAGGGGNLVYGGAGNDLLIANNGAIDMLFGDRNRDTTIADQNDILTGIEVT